jgi:hypothetical protein
MFSNQRTYDIASKDKDKRKTLSIVENKGKSVNLAPHSKLNK